jgi:hypothetical protein
MELVILAICLALALILHHIYIHPNYEFLDRAFQISDVYNHETWVVACLAFAAGLTAATYVK